MEKHLFVKLNHDDKDGVIIHRDAMLMIRKTNIQNRECTEILTVMGWHTTHLSFEEVYAFLKK